MLLEGITQDHIEAAASKIDKEGVPRNHVWNNYYIVVNGKEYPFKYPVLLSLHRLGRPVTEFRSTETNREYIRRLGFEIREYPGGYNFFTPEELAFYASISGKSYGTGEGEEQYYKQKLDGIIAKVNFWASRIAPEGWKVKEDNRWQNRGKIKGYLWPRIYFEEDADVFFNVEVNANKQFIGYKLDGYYQTQKAMSPAQVRILDDFKKRNNIEFVQIPFSKLSDYKWEKLFTASVAYIEALKPKLLELRHLIRNEAVNETRVCRIVWNSNGWKMPSGREGKSTVAGYEAEHGYGFDEWLLDSSREIEGYIYGFLAPVYEDYITNIGKQLDIILFTRSGKDCKNYWVGKLRNVDVLTKIQAANALQIFMERGWYQQMHDDIALCGLNPESIDSWYGGIPEKLINVKFPKESLQELLSELVPLSDQEIIKTYHYKLLRKEVAGMDEQFDQDTDREFSFDSGSTKPATTKSGPRLRSRAEVEIEYRHNDLQSKFLLFLQHQFGEDNVKRECRTFGGCRIDIVRKSSSGFVFYEVKVYNSLRLSIRESLGQLLDYCFFPGRSDAEEILLVSDVQPDEDDKLYLKTIRGLLAISFSYIHFDLVRNEIVGTY